MKTIPFFMLILLILSQFVEIIYNVIIMSIGQKESKQHCYILQLQLLEILSSENVRQYSESMTRNLLLKM